MTFQQELSSWVSNHKSAPPTAEPVRVGDKAPNAPKLGLEAKPTIVAFLRHAGCPWAERAYVNMRQAAKKHGDIDFIAVSHSDQAATDKWLRSLPEPGSEPPNLRIVVDDKRETYAAWGLGNSGWLHALGIGQLWNVYKAGRDEGLKVRPTESGSRWQTSGWYAVDDKGFVTWGAPATRADDVPDFEKAVEILNRSDAKL